MTSRNSDIADFLCVEVIVLFLLGTVILNVCLDLKNEPYIRADGVRRSQRYRGPEMSYAPKGSAGRL